MPRNSKPFKRGENSDIPSVKDRARGYAKIFAHADIMGFIRADDQELVNAVEELSPFTDDSVAVLRSKYQDRNIDLTIRCHVSNISGTRDMQVSDSVLDSLWQDVSESKRFGAGNF